MRRVAESAKKGARISVQMGATWVPNNSVCYDAVNKILPATLKGGTSYNSYPCFFFPLLKLDFNR
jgi:hypothetical protein